MKAITCYGATSTSTPTQVREAIEASWDDQKVAIIPPGSWSTDYLEIPNGCTLMGYGDQSELVLVVDELGRRGENSAIKPKAFRAPDPKAFDISIRNLTIDHNRQGNEIFSTAPGDGTGHCIAMWGVENFKIENVTCLNAHTDGIYICASHSSGEFFNARNGFVSNCVVDGARRQGISVISCEGLCVNGLAVQNVTSISPGAVIDLEPNITTRDIIDRIQISNVTGKNTRAGILMSYSKRVSVSNASFDGLLANYAFAVNASELQASNIYARNGTGNGAMFEIHSNSTVRGSNWTVEDVAYQGPGSSGTALRAQGGSKVSVHNYNAKNVDGNVVRAKDDTCTIDIVGGTWEDNCQNPALQWKPISVKSSKVSVSHIRSTGDPQVVFCESTVPGLLMLGNDCDVGPGFIQSHQASNWSGEWNSW